MLARPGKVFAYWVARGVSDPVPVEISEVVSQAVAVVVDPIAAGRV
jgi:hypothetical protein